MHTKRIIGMLLGTFAILMVPAVAMQFTTEVNWNAFDFVFAFVLIFGTGLLYEFVSSRGGTLAYRAAAGIALLASFLLVWVNGAVGIIGNEGNPANLMYFGVLAVGLVGAALARLDAPRMAYAMYATAVAQALVPIIAFFVWSPQVASWGSPGVAGVFALNAFFVMLYVLSGILFRNAASTAVEREAMA